MNKLFIKVPIVCTVSRGDDGVDYESLGLPNKNDGKRLETRSGGIRVDKITSWYPNMENDATIVELGHEIYVLDISVEDFEDLIKENISNYSTNINDEGLI